MNDGLHEDVGLLEFGFWLKVQQALSESVQVASELREIGGAKIRQEGGTRSTEPALPLHPGWLLAEDIDAINRELHDGWPDDETAANDEEGASLMRRLVNAVQGAYHRFPIGQERAHTVPFIRCQEDGCRGGVVYHPPLTFLGDVHYECWHGHAQDPAKVIEHVNQRAALIKEEIATRARAEKRRRKDREEAKQWA